MHCRLNPVASEHPTGATLEHQLESWLLERLELSAAAFQPRRRSNQHDRDHVLSAASALDL